MAIWRAASLKTVGENTAILLATFVSLVSGNSDSQEVSKIKSQRCISIDLFQCFICHQRCFSNDTLAALWCLSLLSGMQWLKMYSVQLILVIHGQLAFAVV